MKKQMWSRLLSLLLCMVMVFTLTACGKASKETDAVQGEETEANEVEANETESKALLPLRVGVLDAWSGFSTKYIVDNGLDTAAGIKLDFLVFSSGAPANEAMAANEIDCAIIGGAATVAALANLNCKMIMETQNETIGLALVARNDHASTKVTGAVEECPDVLGDAESIKGATIITTTGSLQYYATLKYLEAIGLSEDEVTLVAMDANQAYQAFILGEGDIIATHSGYSFELTKEGYTELASLNSLGCASTSQLVCSAKALEDEDTFNAMAIYAQLLADVNEVMNDDPDFAADQYVDWVKYNGGEIGKENAYNVVSQKPYYTRDIIANREFGSDFLNNYIDFYIVTEQIEESQREVIKENIVPDILKAAGLI